MKTGIVGDSRQIEYPTRMSGEADGGCRVIPRGKIGEVVTYRLPREYCVPRVVGWTILFVRATMAY